MKVLQTERTVLRRFDAGDAALVVELLNDPGWLRFIGDRGVRDVAGARDWIEQRLRAAYRRDGFGLWAIERRLDGAVMGMCGLVNRASLPHVDLGYALLPRFRGHGFAREAAAATLAHASGTLGRGTVLAITHPDNAESIRLLEALGMAFERRALLPGDTQDVLVYAWRARSTAGAEP